jgi:hypothetical protein
MSFWGYFWITYLAGVIVSWFVFNVRAGLNDAKHNEGIDWREFARPNLWWFSLTYLKCWVWWAVLAFWLVQGRPPSQWRALTEVDGRSARRIVRVKPSTVGRS